MTGDAPHRVILLCSDLMMTSQVGAAAAAAGADFLSTSNPDDAIRELTANPSARLLIDFGLPGLDLANFAAQLPPAARAAAVAYGPHVHTTKMTAARDAGIGTVISRGRFASGIPAFLSPADS